MDAATTQNVAMQNMDDQDPAENGYVKLYQTPQGGTKPLIRSIYIGQVQAAAILGITDFSKLASVDVILVPHFKP